MVHQLVIRSAQQRVARIFAPAGAVNHALRVLDTEADGEGLGLHGHAALVEVDKGIACAMTQCHHRVVGGQVVALTGDLVEHLQARQLALLAFTLNLYIGDALLKAHFAAQAHDFFANAFNQLDQLEGADVGVGGVENLWRRAVSHKLGQYLAAQMAGVLDLAVELAVRERARTAFAVLHVGFGRQLALAPQAPGVLGALAHGLAALQHDGLEAHLGQHEACKHAAGAKAHDHGALIHIGGSLAHRRPAHVWRGVDVGVVRKVRQQRGFLAFIGQRDVDDIHRQQLGLARIKAALVHLQGGNGLGGQAQTLGG